MKKVTLILVLLAMMIPTNIFAQRTSDIDGSKDYPSTTRLEGSFIEYYKTTKLDDYKIPLNFNKGNLDFVNPADVEGKIVRIQYSATPDNNTSYVMKTLKTSLVKDGFNLIYTKSNDEIEIQSDKLSSALYGDLNNQKFGFRYDTKGKDQGLIIAKKQNTGKEIFACIYISGFDNVTLITQDIVETDPYTQKNVNPLISDFKDAIKYYQQTTKWDTYMIPIEKEGYDGWENTLKVQGEITRTQYVTSKENNPSFVYMNYTEALKKSNWDIIFGGSGSDALGKDSYEWQYHLFQNYQDKFGDRLGFRAEDRSLYAYVAAKYEDDDNLYYAVIYIIDKGWGTMINQDIIKTKKPDLGSVTAKILTEKIDKKGHLSLDGIFFETGKATLTAESNTTLKNIADYLNAHKDKKFFIVGHTDNVGDFATNMTLSENRAKAVMTELTTKYGVDINQLKAYGVSNLSPVVSNLTDEGKTKNRRVEIVKQ